jgi:hypothetical protein
MSTKIARRMRMCHVSKNCLFIDFLKFYQLGKDAVGIVNCAPCGVCKHCFNPS